MKNVLRAEKAVALTAQAKKGSLEPVYVTKNRECIKQEILKTIDTRASEGKNYVSFDSQLLSEFRERRYDGSRLMEFFQPHTLFTLNETSPTSPDKTSNRIGELRTAFDYLKGELKTWLEELGYHVNSVALKSWDEVTIFWLNEEQLALMSEVIARSNQLKAFDDEFRNRQEESNVFWQKRGTLETNIKALSALNKNNPKCKELPVLQNEFASLLKQERVFGKKRAESNRRHRILTEQVSVARDKFKESIGYPKN